MKINLSNYLSKSISICFYALFFLTPLVFTPINSELFELNKMVVVYFFASLIFAFWLIKSVIKGKLVVRRTPLDLPILLFLMSQIVSTLFSLDPHVSIWGYYGRFNGGLIPTITYIFLYYAFVSNFSDLRKILFCILSSGLLVSIYALLQKLGIDKHIWVQDVENRVFSTLGQPNWLAAYIVIVLLITMGSLIVSSIKYQELRKKNLVLHVSCYMLHVLCFMFYAVLLFTRSRSGFLAFWVVDVIFWLGLLIFVKEFRKKLVSLFVICHLSFVILTFVFASPFPQINKYLYITSNFQQPTANSQQTIVGSRKSEVGSQVSETNITESGEIRKLVWQGAIEAFKARPYFGWGVETFAWVFYKFKPPEHNLTSEWDFLYNKAHNEYLNYAATSGGFGLGSHILIILTFLFIMVKKIKEQKSKIKNKNEKILNFKFIFDFCILNFALFLGWLSILITNFFGFSVLVVSLFFYLIPAMIFSQSEQKKYLMINLPHNFKLKVFLLFVFLLFTVYCLLFTVFFWLSDVYYAKAMNYEDQEEYSKAYDAITTAVKLKPDEPNFRDQLALESAYLSLLSYEQDETTKSAEFAKQAENESDIAIAISPNNLNFRKTRTRLFYVLTQMDDMYLRYSIHSLLSALILSPNDAKIRYNLAILYWSDEQKEEAKKTLHEALEIKPNYKDAAYGLAVFAEQEKDTKEAQKWYRYILEKIDPSDEEVKKRVE